MAAQVNNKTEQVATKVRAERPPQPPVMHGKINYKAMSQKEKDAWKEYHLYMAAKDSTPVRGRFIFHEVPNGFVEFNYSAYPGEGTEKYTMYDGQVYTVPLGVAKHLNKNCWYPEYEHATSEGMIQNIQRIGKKTRRVSFQSLEFVENEELTPIGSAQVYTVENIGTAPSFSSGPVGQGNYVR